MEKTDSPYRKPTEKALTAAIQACLANGNRLLEDADWVRPQEPPASFLALSMIAQEEFAKAFLLIMVKQDAIPWSRHLLRAMNDHVCKQLVAIILEYVNPDWESADDLNRQFQTELELGDRFPADVGSALEIFRHEKIGRWESNTWVWGQDPAYEPSVLRVAEGKRDRMKQDALYVRVGRDGQVASTPGSVTSEQAIAELEAAKRYGSTVSSMATSDKWTTMTFDKVRAAFKHLFSDVTVTPSEKSEPSQS